MVIAFDRPIFSFDIDGVLASPPLGRTFNANRKIDLLPASNTRGIGVRDAGMRNLRPSWWDRLVMRAYYPVRYRGRMLCPGAIDTVQAAAESYRLVLLSARNWRGRSQTEAWLRKYDLLNAFDALILNDTHLSPPQFKRRVTDRLGVARHVDDDPATAALIARGGARVDLIETAASRDLAHPAGVRRWHDLQALATALRAEVARETNSQGGGCG